jgi:hypothetical protein
MARNYAKIHTTIWSDEDFKSLDPSLQHAFFVLVSQPRLSMCGLLDYVPQRLARCSSGWTVDDVESLMKGLEEARYVIVDRDTQELLVRTFIRNDGVLGSPNLAIAATREYAEVMSQKLRDAIESELVKAYREDSNQRGWGAVSNTNPVLMKRVVERGSR